MFSVQVPKAREVFPKYYMGFTGPEPREGKLLKLKMVPQTGYNTIRKIVTDKPYHGVKAKP